MKFLGQERLTANPIIQMLVGGLTGLVYQLYSYPFDTVKANIQSGDKVFL